MVTELEKMSDFFNCLILSLIYILVLKKLDIFSPIFIKKTQLKIFTSCGGVTIHWHHKGDNCSQNSMEVIHYFN